MNYGDYNEKKKFQKFVIEKSSFLLKFAFTSNISCMEQDIKFFFSQ